MLDNTDSQSNNDDSRQFKWWMFLVAAFFILIICLIYALMLSNIDFKGFNENDGTFGDSFGALNTLFSGLAFAGVICTIIMQSEELRLQRKELKDTKAELAKSAIAQEQQVENQIAAAKLQALTTLFDAQDINPHHNINIKPQILDLIEETLEELYGSDSQNKHIYVTKLNKNLFLAFHELSTEYEKIDDSFTHTQISQRKNTLIREISQNRSIGFHLLRTFEDRIDPEKAELYDSHLANAYNEFLNNL